MPRISLWQEGRRTNDYRFIDQACNEMFTLGGTGVLVHKYLGPRSNALTLTVTAAQTEPGIQLLTSNTTGVAVGNWVAGTGISAGTRVGVVNSTGISLTKPTTAAVAANTQLVISASADASQPATTEPGVLQVQDWLLQENRDREYDPDVYEMRGVYNVSQLDYDLSQFGLFLQNDVIFITFHLNTLVQRLGRKIISGDVLELPHLLEFYDLDESVAAALPRFYVVQEAQRSAEGYSATWWPHLWRVKAVPMPGTQEYQQILQSLVGESGNTVADLLSQNQIRVQQNQAVLAAAEQQVPASGYNTEAFWIPPFPGGDRTQVPLPPDSAPEENWSGYLTGDGVPPNGLPVQPATSFPTSAAQGTYVLRTDYRPNRLYVRLGQRWQLVEQSVRTGITPGTGSTQRDEFINNNSAFVNSTGATEPSRQTLSQLLGPESDV